VDETISPDSNDVPVPPALTPFGPSDIFILVNPVTVCVAPAPALAAPPPISETRSASDRAESVSLTFASTISSAAETLYGAANVALTTVSASAAAINFFNLIIKAPLLPIYRKNPRTRVLPPVCVVPPCVCGKLRLRKRRFADRIARFGNKLKYARDSFIEHYYYSILTIVLLSKSLLFDNGVE
jgi:hypothetical protein